ncbi:MFS transporter [Amycolatopsis pigmentata]|uniref:MFS transporter n=1 Tax=Amycolatopsis pigmentata TaxID=450801 RepID=A0ABW5G6S6_9PSEU
MATAMFMVILDSAMVNLAGPTIRAGLALTDIQLTLVIDSYLVPFAGLLLLGGRLADLLGGRKVLLTGMGAYLLASIVCTVATSGEMLIAARIGQGISAALVLPSALSLVLALYPSRTERTRAMGIWGAVAGAASLGGVFLGGSLTETLGWESVFWTPVPFGILGAVIVWRSVPSIPVRSGHFDAFGAVTLTAGISALALGMISASEAGWGSLLALGGLAVGVAFLVAFVVVERRSAHPLVPLGVFGRKPVVMANLVMLLVGGTLTSLFFLLPPYQEEVLGMSPLETGMSQLPLAAMIIVGSVLAPLLTKLIGLTRALPVALAVLLAGLLWLAFDLTRSGFSASLLGAFVLIGGGLGLSAVNATAMSVRDATEAEGGLLSGLISAAQQLGGAVGLAGLVGIVAISSTTGTATATDGGIDFTTAFLGAAAGIIVALALSLFPGAKTPTTPNPAGTH